MAPPVRRFLDAVVRSLFEPLLRRSGEGSFTVLSWDVEAGLSLVVDHRSQVILIELGDVDESHACFGRTARFNLTARYIFDRDKPLSAASARFVESVLRMIRLREQHLPTPERPTTTRRAMLREILVERLLMPESRGQYYLNPYVGCTIGCGFCYVAARADMSRRLEGLPRMEWGRYLDVKVNAAEVLRADIERFPPGLVRMSPILTDPYLPAERRFGITRACLEVLLEGGFTPVILTRSRLVTRDLDLLRRFPAAAVGFSIPTDDDRQRQTFEPGADPIAERLAALEACRQAGLTTFAVVQPMLPMDAENLARRIAPLVDAVRIDRMHSLPLAQPLYTAAGAEDAASPAFFERTGAALAAELSRLGIPLDDLDDLGGLLGLRPLAPAG